MRNTRPVVGPAGTARRILAVLLSGAVAGGMLTTCAATTSIPAAATPSAGSVSSPSGILVSRQLAESLGMVPGSVIRLSADPAGAEALKFRIARVYEPDADPMKLTASRSGGIIRLLRIKLKSPSMNARLIAARSTRPPQFPQIDRLDAPRALSVGRENGCNLSGLLGMEWARRLQSARHQTLANRPLCCGFVRKSGVNALSVADVPYGSDSS